LTIEIARFTRSWCKQQACAAPIKLTSHRRREQKYFSWNIWANFASKDYQRPYRGEGKKKISISTTHSKITETLATSKNNRRLL